MEPSFNISGQDVAQGALHLLAEAGLHGVSFVQTLLPGRVVTACKTYHFEPGNTPAAAAQQLATVLEQEPLLNASYSKIDLVAAFPEAIITPHEVYNALHHSRMLEDVYGDLQEGVVKTDFLYRHNLHNVYRVPFAVHRLLDKHFSTASHWHQHSILVDALPGEGDVLHAVFYPGRVTVLLYKAGRLYWIQHFTYTTPETAAWVLLSVLQQAGLAADAVAVILYGMVEEQSALYKELYKYLLHLSFAPLPAGLEYPQELQTQPPHFFAHLFACLPCVL